MSRTLDVKTPRRFSVKLAAQTALCALLVLGTLAASASADGRRDDRHAPARHQRGHNDWRGASYAAPPVVYGSPYYAPPPVVYGPAIGVMLPGISIGIR